MASLDGESFSPIPLMLEDDEDSQENKAEVPKEEYRFLKWFISELRSGDSIHLESRYRVLGAPIKKP